MKVILLSDVERLGQLGDEVTVAKGYGRNYLIPQGFALLSTPQNIKLFEERRAEYQQQVDNLRSEAHALQSKIDGKVIQIQVRTGENNKLYGSVTTQMIADALASEGISVDKRKILLDSQIRSTGDYSIRIRLHADIVAFFTVSVISDRTEVFDDDILLDNASENAEESVTIEEVSSEE